MQVSQQGHLLFFQEADVALHTLDLMLQGHGIHGNPGLGPTWGGGQSEPTSSGSICPQIPHSVLQSQVLLPPGDDSAAMVISPVFTHQSFTNMWVGWQGNIIIPI